MNDFLLETEWIRSLISDHALIGGVSITLMVMVYKIYQIIKRDKKEDSISEFETIIRTELRGEILALKAENKKLKLKNNELATQVARYQALFENCIQTNLPCPFKGEANASDFRNLSL